jgi:protoporphyrinogen oxidase
MSKGEGKKAIIIGAGPAGLTAAYELLMHSDIKPVVVEMTQDMGGISKTVNYKGNRIDIGGHRFFSKSSRVMNWWTNILPVQGMPKDASEVDISYQNKKTAVSIAENGPDPDKTDRVMLIRNRLSRIFFLGKFFSYPISLSWNTLSNLGLVQTIGIGFSYMKSTLFPIKPERSLEDFIINRFGKKLYLTFFKDYTEKVWGTPCNEISAEWGAQRIKGLSIWKAILHVLTKSRKKSSINQKDTETSLIERFMYPKLGPGQMWDEVSKIVQAKGGEVIRGKKVTRLNLEGKRITEIEITDSVTKEKQTLAGDYFFSTMPVKELIQALGDKVPANVREVSEGLLYRDFITVGLLLSKLKIKNETEIKTLNQLIPDSWIYIQERQVKLGRLQVFNNWSPYMVSDINKVWIGLEYFCNEGDELWNMKDEDFMRFAIRELASINIIEEKDVLDSTILRMPKAYPAYFGTYDRFAEIRAFTDSIENLFLVGRNGMHKYNNQDHSMLTAMTAVENIINGVSDKSNLWSINTEMDYHEEKK